MITPKEIWIEKGYEIYALNGLESLKVEKLAKIVGVSKSSFYNYFADLECFLENLFDHHLKRFVVLSKEEANCKSIHPELINVLIEHKIDLLFHRQLRINRNDRMTGVALEKSSQVLGNYGVMLWARDINLKLTTNQLKGLFEIATEDFYMRINKDNFHRQFLVDYFENLTRISKRLV